jgi:hypothetical protein
MKRRFYILYAAVLLPLALSAKDMTVWRAPTQTELGQNSDWRNGDQNRYLLAKADFDGGSKEDIARLLINDEESKIGLMVTLSSAGKAEPLLLEAINEKRMIEVMGIEVAKPGTYETACGKGYWDCKKNELKQVLLIRPAIDFFRHESANSYFLWNTNSKRFDRIWMSD